MKKARVTRRATGRFPGWTLEELRETVAMTGNREPASPKHPVIRSISKMTERMRQEILLRENASKVAKNRLRVRGKFVKPDKPSDLPGPAKKEIVISTMADLEAMLRRIIREELAQRPMSKNVYLPGTEPRKRSWFIRLYQAIR